MQKLFVRTHAPVTEEQIELLRQVGIDVGKFASNQVFWGTFSPDHIALMKSWSWVESIEADVQFQTFDPAVEEGGASAASSAPTYLSRERNVDTVSPRETLR
jgi:hypothetical protein